MEVTQVSLQGATAAFSVNAMPADCTMLALSGVLFGFSNFALVVSGINRGNNAGLHVVYSGTCTTLDSTIPVRTDGGLLGGKRKTGHALNFSTL